MFAPWRNPNGVDPTLSDAVESVGEARRGESKDVFTVVLDISNHWSSMLNSLHKPPRAIPAQANALLLAWEGLEKAHHTCSGTSKQF